MADNDGWLGKARDERGHVPRVVGDALLCQLRIGRTRRARDVEGQVKRLASPAARRENRHDVREAPAAAEGAVDENDGFGHGSFAPGQARRMPAGGYDFTRRCRREASVDDLAAGTRGIDERERLRGGGAPRALEIFRGTARPAAE